MINFDFDNDGYEDLLIGSPFYTNSTCDDCGRIYYHKQNEVLTNWELKQIIDSPIENARFGWSLGLMGDLDTRPGVEIVAGMPTSFDNHGGIAILSFDPNNGTFEISQ